MRYIAFATDYDGTLAAQGNAAEATLRVLDKVKASGRKLILVTGRHLKDLQSVFPRLDLFERVVVENGALLYDPLTREQRALCEPPPETFLSLLRQLGVPFEVGRGIVSTWVPHEVAVLDAIRRLALDLQVTFNKGAVMVLPSSVNKATGLKAALSSLQLSFHNTVAIGDAENDHAFISSCECGVAVANAVPALKDRADVQMKSENGAAVAQLAEQLLEDDLARYDSFVSRYAIVLGAPEDNSAGQIRISPYRNSILVAGASASGKSTAVAGILEQMAEQDYQFCLIDPEGDFEHFAGALSFGTTRERPDPETIIKALESPDRSIIVNLMALGMAERPKYFAALLPRILETRAKTARPHWIVIDEAHHLLPTSWSPASSTVPHTLGGTILITVHPEHVSSAALSFVDMLVATGQTAPEALSAFAKVVGIRVPALQTTPDTGQALVWFTRDSGPRLVRIHAAKAERRRHRRNYAEGELSPDQSFYFRGPESKLHLRAQNLITFQQLAEGVDDDTWLFHLRRQDYSRWFEDMIKDPDLAKAAAAIEQNPDLSAIDSRDQIKELIHSRYTAPA